MNKQGGFSLIELLSILLMIVLSINASLAFVSHYGFNIYYNLFIIPIVFCFILILPIYLGDVFQRKTDNKSLQLLGKVLTTLYIVTILILAIFIPLFLYNNYILLISNVVLLFPYLLMMAGFLFAKK
jgi:hypothetical protein